MLAYTSDRPATRLDPILIEIQKKIYGQRKDNLTALELYKLFQTPLTPEFNLILYRALQRKAINPDLTLLQAIASATSRDYFIPIALCLRHGADANMYVDAPPLGTIHILGYVYNTLGDNPDLIFVLTACILMLMVHGARPSLPIFDTKAGKIRIPGEINHSASVLEWLNTQGYETILNRISSGNIAELKRSVDLNALTILSILLDMTTLMGRPYETSDILLAIRSFSHTVFDALPTPTETILLDYTSLDATVTYLDSGGFDKLLKRRQLPSYVLVNNILIALRAQRTNGNTVAFQELEHMLLSSLSTGIQLDPQQLTLISTLGHDTLEAVNKEYGQPYWRKVCKNPQGTIPVPLQHLAMSLNIDPSMSMTALCEHITTLSKSDKETLKEAARKRQQTRLAGTLGTLSEFINGKIPTLVCRNKSLLPQDPMDYNDLDIAYYRDDQGAIWCFPSDMFNTLLETGLNPYNSTRLPDTFLMQVQYQTDVLKKIGTTNSSFSKAIDSLSEKDTITEVQSAAVLAQFTQLAANNGISAETLNELSKERLLSAFRALGYEINLLPLTNAHALITSAYIINFLGNASIFFDALRV